MNILKNLKIGTIPVKIHWTFLFLFILLVFTSFEILFAAIVALLVHELGHSLMFKHYGHSPEIVLTWFGGVTSIEPEKDFLKSEIIKTTLAGPLANICLAMVLFPLCLVFPEYFSILIYINLFMGIFNLFPILPLDGGVLLSTLLKPGLYKKKIVFWIGNIFGLSVGIILFLVLGDLFLIMFNFIFLVVLNYYSGDSFFNR